MHALQTRLCFPRFGLPAVSRGQRRLLVSVLIDTAGAGLYLPLSLLFFVAYQGLPAAVAGTAVTTGSVASFALVPLCGRAVQRFGPKRCLGVSNLLTALGYGSYFLAHDFWTIAAAALIIMGSDRLYGAAWPTAVARISTPEQLTMWFSFVNFLKTSCLGLGAVASTGLMALAGRDGLALALALNAASSVVAAVLLTRVAIPDANRAPADRPSTATVRDVLRSRPFMSLVVSQTLLSAAWLIPTVAFPVYLVETLHQNPLWPTAVVAVRYGVIATLQVPVIAHVSAWPRQRVLLYAIGVAALAISLTCTLPLAAHGAQGTLAALIAALLATAELVSKPTASAAAVRLSPTGQEGPYMAVFQLTWTLAYAVGPAIIGIGLSHPEYLWLGLGVCVLASAAAHVMGERPSRRALRLHVLTSTTAEESA